MNLAEKQNALAHIDKLMDELEKTRNFMRSMSHERDKGSRSQTSAAVDSVMKTLKSGELGASLKSFKDALDIISNNGEAMGQMSGVRESIRAKPPVTRFPLCKLDRGKYQSGHEEVCQRLLNKISRAYHLDKSRRICAALRRKSLLPAA